MLLKVKRMATTRRSRSWRKRYDELVKFKKRYKRLPTLKPSAYGTVLYSLATWLANQRKHIRSGLLTKRQDKLLQSIGVVRNPATENKKRWEGRLRQLVEFRKKNPDRWPSKDVKDREEKLLGSWCHYNRMWYRGKLKGVGPYPEYRVKKLERIGFKWNQDDRERRWNKKYREIKKFRKENPGRWPPVKMYPFYKWMQNQRRFYRKGTLQQERIDLLNKLGFVWNPGQEKN